MKAYWRSGGIAPRTSLTSILDGSGQLHAPAALPPGKEPLVPLDMRLGGPQSRSGHSGGEEKNSQPLTGPKEMLWGIEMCKVHIRKCVKKAWSYISVTPLHLRGVVLG
jgi:hypothetical protein